jgi:hypothetical protein
VGIAPNRKAIVRLGGAVLAEQIDEWTATRRRVAVEALARTVRSPRDTAKRGRRAALKLVA